MTNCKYAGAPKQNPEAGSAFAVGDKVTWLHRPRGGYGYTFYIPARVIGFAATGRVKVLVEKADGLWVERFVREENLSSATPPAPAEGKEEK